jgi:hypothetical protein
MIIVVGDSIANSANPVSLFLKFPAGSFDKSTLNAFTFFQSAGSLLAAP